MKKIYSLLIVFLLLFSSVQSQQINGKLDDIKEFSTKLIVPFVMPDGVKLFTDIYVPRLRDSLVVDLGTIDVLGTPLQTNPITFIPLGAQIIFYDSLNGQPNPNPYQLPTIFTRTPYDKGDFDELGGIMPILGYNYILQDMRGRYSSEGVYFPMYSDSWNKNAYHPGEGHILDYLDPTDPKHSTKHEDGYNSVKIIQSIDSAYGASVGVPQLANLFTEYPHTNTRVNNGTIGMFGASALGNTQLQLGLAHRIPDSLPHLKCLMPIVATTEHYISTGYNNGVFRDRIVTGWLKGQIFSGTDDDLIPIDNDRQNTIHSSFDYDLPKEITVNGVTKLYEANKFEAANLAIDHFTATRYPDENGVLSNAGFYPNSIGRGDMDGSCAPVDATGEAVMADTIPGLEKARPNLNYSRYTNLDVPILHITGWWDIFTEGQINNLEFSRQALSGTNKNMQKMIIGPWAHQTIASRQSGDRVYPINVADITKIDLTDFDIDNIPIGEIVKSDLVTWFRYNLNYHPDYTVGEPKFIIRESQRWQSLGSTPLLGDIEVRVPSEDFVVTYVDMINFLGGNGELGGLKIELRNAILGSLETTIDVPVTTGGLGQFSGSVMTEIPFRDFLNDIPNYRFYCAGPDSAADAILGYPDNYRMGNYWMTSDKFPPDEHISWKKMFMHQDGSFNESSPVQDEGYKTYVHDPDDPILTVGGANMIVRSPDGTRNSQSQMEMTDPTNAPFTMDREGVIQFNSDPIQDSLTIVGFPVCTLYAKSNPAGIASGPTDADFFVRICDVWPDGRVFYVDEGCVGARGRDWARALVDKMGTPGEATYVNGVEDPGDKDLPFSNINIGEVYEYVFKSWPIAYTFAKGHQVRILISSSNYTRYQVNPSLPLNDGEFFRRKPGDGQFYMFEGQPMFPRVAVQRVHFSPEHPSSINFPVYNKDFIYNDIKPIEVNSTFDASVFPTLVSEGEVQVFVNQPGDKQITITDISGRVVTTAKFDDNMTFNVDSYLKGVYFATITDLSNKANKVTKKFVVQ